MTGAYVAYVGTYTHENSVGIHIYDVEPEKGALTERKVIPINNPSDLIVSNSGKYLYSIADEGVEAFSILPDGDLKSINKKWIGGMRGCYVELDKEDRYLFVGGYHDGRVSMMRLSEDGSIVDVADGIFHKGLGRGIAERASRPHVECVKVTPDQKFLCAVDSGLDHVKIYRIDYERGRIKLADNLRCELNSGPRMIRFSKDKRFAYVLCQLKNTVEVYRYYVEEDQPVFEWVQSVVTAERTEGDSSSASGMERSLDGKYLFVSNVGINNVVIYEIDQETGCLTQIMETRISGDYPKALAVFPDGQHFASLNHDSDEIRTFKINYEEKYCLMDARPVGVETPNCIYIHQLGDE
ncbi:MAG: lactonase family protein [Lachnospiraceae bacterium]|nr:lactonase family protein [Lachnospiraceae bacterium]